MGVNDAGTPQIEWRAVPPGEVALEVPRRLLGGTRPQRKLIESFHIGRFPVAVAQYRAFLNAGDGWRDEGSWAPDLYRDPEGRSYDRGRFGNEPAVYISWFDALAFCRWLSHCLGFNVSLPDEWQWQQAATGGDPGKVYPWGSAWDPQLEPHRATPSRASSQSRLQLACIRAVPRLWGISTWRARSGSGA